MKRILTLLFLVCVSSFWAQQDTIFMTPRQVADSLFSIKNISNTPTGLLFNRMFLTEEQSVVGHFFPGSVDTSNADFFYSTLNEIQSMAFDSSLFLSPSTAFDRAFEEFAKEKYEDNSQTVIPLSFVNQAYNILPFDDVLGTSILDQDVENINSSYFSVDQMETKRVMLLAPTLDYLSEEKLYFTLPSNLILSDDEVLSIELKTNDSWVSYQVNSLIPYQTKPSARQVLNFRVRLSSGDTINQIIVLSTPELFFKNKSSFNCDLEGNITGNDGVKIEACYTYGCGDSGMSIGNIDKPFFLVTGYRPPIFGQSFKKTWENYSNNHDSYLENLKNAGYDIILVRNNMHNKPNKLGIEEYADLLIQLINHVNTIKQVLGSHYENVIQGCSMGADAVNLALLKMEKNHWESGGLHHHTRLFIAYDANFYGANFPLATQFMVKNYSLHRDIHLDINGISPFLLWYLNNTIDAKALRQLVKYHVEGFGSYPTTSRGQYYYTPKEHHYREDIVALMNSLNRKGSIVPLPESTRNISISLGAIRGTNDEQPAPDSNFPYNTQHVYAGEELFIPNVNSFGDTHLGFAKYNANYHHRIYRRRSFYGFWYVPFVFTDQGFHMNQMLEIDNASGSYLKGIGNTVDIPVNAVMGPFFLLNNRYASHKATVSALAINPNLWPANGSMTLDMHELEIMYDDWKTIGSNQEQSNFYGYPHIGRPNDYAQVTPFDAIYVDDRVDPHIDLDGRLYKTELNNFLYNEIEPWYLALQNQQLGGQARPDYRYKAKLRARNAIWIGSKVTPKTPQGTYLLKANADLTLRAGEYIDFVAVDGQEVDVLFDMEEGASIDIAVGYEQCDNYKSNLGGDSSGEDSVDEYAILFDTIEELREEEKTIALQVIPNPNTGLFSIQFTDRKKFDNYRIYSLSGVLIKSNTFEPLVLAQVDENLAKGTYVVIVSLDGKSYHQKLVVV